MKIYLYLQDKNKENFKLLSVFNGPTIKAKQIHNIADLKLPAEITEKASEIIYEHRMGWDLWMESAGTYRELVENIKFRGGGLPLNSAPLLNTHSISIGKMPVRKTMLRRD